MYRAVEKQTSIGFLDQFNIADKGKPLSMTTFVPGETFRGMTLADRETYWKLKAMDVANKWKSIPYFDNECTTENCRLVLELDKKTSKFEHDRIGKMMNDVELIVEKVNETFDSGDGLFLYAHVLSRPPSFDGKKRVWKYGLHIVFPSTVVSLNTGMFFSKNVAKIFPEEGEGYVDGVYSKGLARLRPAYARKKCQGPGEQYPHGSSYYTYFASFDKGGLYQDKALNNAYTILRETSLIPLNDAKKSKKRKRRS